MPQDPLELIDDLSRMGFYDPKAIPIAEELSFKEIRKTLFLRMAVQGNPKREKLCNALIQQAGGLDAAFSAAFGPKAGEFFGDAIKASSITRKEFLRNLAVGAALVSLTNCAGPSNDAVTQGAGDDEIIGNLEKTTIKVGFVPITCATPILMAGPRGIYEKYGLNVELVKMPGWAAVRDAISSGELDASHLIAPMPIAMTLGIGSTAFSTRSLIISNLNGNAITVAKQHEQRVKGPADFKGFRIAIPFPYSTHTLLLRYYLATGGLDPDTDVQLDVVPPPDTVAQMSIGDLDAMLIAEPFNQRLVSEGAGYIHMLSKDLWPGHPCCILGAGQEWMDNHPNTFQALTKAVLEAAHYSKDKSNRSEISQTLSTRAFLNQPQEVLDSVYLGNFDDGRGNSLDIPDRVDFDPYPWQSFSHWIVSQMVRWNNLSQEALTDYRQIGEEIFLSELIQEMSTELNLPVPNEKERVEQLMFDSLDPNDPKGYLQNQLEKYGL
ncbi:CmpA/NrtA family ABC transporter substrate-binding protein [Nodosilinea sp. P-1105]|uniref:CmpA/NrtA family ABC transporter substrate-binding protein n=1 Tax=Nodosilinea sp. P-1105 TaxID=2546229 RepID=UPI001F0E8467|nr:CmpA/NrtA family ABC transporter substrate-binding protein [Nodosilinea sp. P-1105]